MIDFRVLGSLDLRGPDGEQALSILAQPKRTALLSYLALAEPGAFHRRDKLVGLFWPELDQDRARGALRKSVYFLRRSLGDEIILNRGDESVGLDWEQISVDAGAFTAALDARDFEAALELYRGDLLEGFFLEGCPEFESWLEGERARLKELASGAAWSLAHQLLEVGRINEGERAANRALSLIPTDESEARRFLLALAEAGDRAAAVQFFETFSQGIWEALQLEPSAETRAALEEIRSGGDGTEPAKIPKARGPEAGGPDSPLSTAEHPGGSMEPIPEPAFLSRSESRPADPEVVAAPGSPGEDLAFLKRELAPELEILRRIRSGTIGDVFLARQKTLDRLVVVKVLIRERADDPATRTRFEREARAVASVDHPNVARVYWFATLPDGVPYMVRQYVKGGTLEDLLASEGPLPTPRVREILAQVASALAAAHRSGFVHRDLRPATVLYDPHSGKAVLFDFALTGILPEKEGLLPRVTMVGEVLGNTGSLSPEQLKGGEATPETDVYALGVLGYEVLTGETPFPGKTEGQQARGHLYGTPRPITALRPDVPEDLADLLERCLAKEPRLRPRPEYIAEVLGRAEGETRGAGAAERESSGKEAHFLASLLPGGAARIPAKALTVGVVLALALIGLLWVIGRAVSVFA